LCSQMPSMGRWLPRRLCPRWRLCWLLCRRSTAHNHNKIKQMNGTDTAATATATATAATSSQQQHHHRNSNSFAEKCACMWACVGNFVACIPGAQIFRESWKRTFSQFSHAESGVFPFVDVDVNVGCCFCCACGIFIG